MREPVCAVDLTRCAFNPTNLGCFSERCPNDPLSHWASCALAQPPCPDGARCLCLPSVGILRAVR